jgi:hypothetical protein
MQVALLAFDAAVSFLGAAAICSPHRIAGLSLYACVDAIHSVNPKGSTRTGLDVAVFRQSKMLQFLQRVSQ